MRAGIESIEPVPESAAVKRPSMLLSLEIELAFKIVECGHADLEGATEERVFESVDYHFSVLFLLLYQSHRVI